MKQLLVLFVGCCLLPVGCMSTSNMPSRFTSSLFGKKSSDHTLAQDKSAPKKGNSDKLSLASQSDSPFGKGEEALNSGNLREAKKQFQKVVQQDPNHAAAHHRLAYIADQNKDYSIAEIHYLAALRIDPRNADIACDLGYSYLLQDRFDDARRYLEKALTSDPRHQAALLNLATLHSKQGDYAGTLAMLRQAVSEEEAQAHIAQLFPDGPPDGTQLANNAAQEVSPATRELQQKLAQRSQRNQAPQQRQTTAQAKRPMDLHNMDPREIPPEMINDMFAQIDQEAEHSRMNAPPISPANSIASNPGQTVHAQVNHEQPNEPAFAAQPFPSTIPGDLPTKPQNDPYAEYAVIGPPPRQPQPAAQSQPASQNTNNSGQNSPYFQPEDMIGMQQPGAPGSQPNQTIAPAGGLATSNGQGPAMTGLERPTAGAMPAPGQRPAGTHPFAHLPEVGQTPPPAGNGSSLSYQDAMAKALQMGMSAGPGQMFPANLTASETQSSNRPTSGLDSIRPIPSASLNMPPRQELPTMPELRQPTPEASGSTGAPHFGLNLPASSQPEAPASDPAGKPSRVPGQIQQTSNSNAAVRSETPWFDGSDSVQTTQSNRQPLPERTPQPNYQTPQQWPHSPQAEQSSNQNGNYAPMIHRGTRPGNSTPPQQQESLPQVVPGVR